MAIFRNPMPPSLKKIEEELDVLNQHLNGLVKAVKELNETLQKRKEDSGYDVVVRE